MILAVSVAAALMQVPLPLTSPPLTSPPLTLPALTSPAPVEAAEQLRFDTLVTDWQVVNREALEHELRLDPPATATPARNALAARSLGDRVGELVASGDCEAGERMAREAGDFALMRAVRTHCRVAPSRP